MKCKRTVVLVFLIVALVPPALAQQPDATYRAEVAAALTRQVGEARGHPVTFATEGADATTLVEFDEHITSMGVSNFFAQQQKAAAWFAKQGFTLYIATNGKQWWIARPSSDGAWLTANGPFVSRAEAMRWWHGGRLINPANGMPFFPDPKNNEAATAQANSAANQLTTNDSGAPSKPPLIPGRISNEQLQAILTAADADSQQTVTDLFKQTAVVSAALLSIQSQASRYPNFAAHPLIRNISSLQGRLGKSLQPRQIEDILELNELLRQCLDIFYNLAPPDSSSIYGFVRQAIDTQRQRQEQIIRVKNLITDTEDALDRGNLNRAGQLYGQLSSDSFVTQSAPAQRYLQQTQSLGLDLAAYLQAAQFAHQRNLSLVQQLQNLRRETEMLNASQSIPLTRKYLQDAIRDDTEAVRQKLASLPAFQFDEASYRIPGALPPATSSKLNDRLAFVTSRIKDIDDRLASASEVRAIIAQPEATKTVEQMVGGSEATALKATAVHIAAAERARASLVDIQNSIQASIAAQQEAEQRRIAAENERWQNRVITDDDLLAFENHLIQKYRPKLTVIHGRRFRVAPSYHEHGDNGPDSIAILQEMLNWIPRRAFVDQLSLYKLIGGLDGSSTAQALDKLRPLTGKYVMLQGDVFQIRADRDYPHEGLNEFTVFGNVELVNNLDVPTNVLCMSAEKVPPYRVAPILGKIIDFRLAESLSGKTLIVPVVRVIVVASGTSFTSEPSEIIIN